MFDLIDITATLLAILLLVIAAVHFKGKSKVFALCFVILSLWPLMWAGFIRLHIPQTLIWMGMNILAIIFVWQGISGFIFRQVENNILRLPSQLSLLLQNLGSLIIGLLFAILIILTRF